MISLQAKSNWVRALQRVKRPGELKSHVEEVDTKTADSNSFYAAVPLAGKGQSSWPTGLTATPFSPNPTYGSASVTISTTASTPAGVYTLQYTADERHDRAFRQRDGYGNRGGRLWPEHVAHGADHRSGPWSHADRAEWIQFAGESDVGSGIVSGGDDGEFRGDSVRRAITITINTSSTTPVGTYPLRYTATGGGWSHPGVLQITMDLGGGQLDDIIACGSTGHWTDVRIIQTASGHSAQSQEWWSGQKAET